MNAITQLTGKHWTDVKPIYQKTMTGTFNGETSTL